MQPPLGNNFDTPAPSPGLRPEPAPAPAKKFRAWLWLLLAFSVMCNLLFCLIGMAWIGSRSRSAEFQPLQERFYAGNEHASAKIAIVRIENIIAEPTLVYPMKQIEQASENRDVKAVVVRIDSPGGTITASEALHQRLTELREGTARKWKPSGPKPLVASFGGLAASGGYYIAMPAQPIFAERTTLTGSIGVYAALPNIAKFAERNGIELDLIKAGDIKASGSLFHTLTPQERQPWQDMVNAAYERFLQVVAEGRGIPPEKWRSEKLFEKEIFEYDAKGNRVVDPQGQPKKVKYARVRADGGTFTAAEAKQYGLIDEIGDLFAAVDAAAGKAGLTDYQVIVYERPLNALDLLFGMQANSPTPALPDWSKLSQAAYPRLWYLAPNAEMAGIWSFIQPSLSP